MPETEIILTALAELEDLPQQTYRTARGLARSIREKHKNHPELCRLSQVELFDELRDTRMASAPHRG